MFNLKSKIIEEDYLEKIILFWGVLDLVTFGYYLVFASIIKGEFFYYYGIKSAIGTARSLGAPFPIYLAIVWTILSVSTFVSGMLLIKKKTIGGLLVYLQTPLRMIVAEPSITLILLFSPVVPSNKTITLFFITIVVFSEIFKVASIALWRGKSKRIEAV